MTDSGTITSTNSSVGSTLDKCSSDFQQLNTQWEGDSYDGLNTKVSNFSKDAKSKIDAKMQCLAEFASIHKDYVTLSKSADSHRQVRADHSSSSGHAENCHWTKIVHADNSVTWSWHPCSSYNNAKNQVSRLVQSMHQLISAANRVKSSFPKDALDKDDGGIDPFTDYGN